MRLSDERDDFTILQDKVKQLEAKNIELERRLVNLEYWIELNYLDESDNN